MDTEKIKRYSLVEVSLLAFFMFGLILASWIANIRSRVILSDLIPLPGSGLAVSVPANKGWEQTPEWQYEEANSSMTLISQFGDPERRGIEVRWRYNFSSPTGSEQELLEQKAKAVNAAIQDLDTAGQKYKMTYAKLLLPQSPGELVYIGILCLEPNRSLELLVKSYGSTGFYEEKILESVANSIQYTPLNEVANGHALMESFLLDDKNFLNQSSLPEEAFLIKNSLGKNQGYYHARFLAPDEKDGLFRAKIQQLEPSLLKLDSHLSFDPIGNSIQWNTKLSNPRIKGTLAYEIQMDGNTVFTVMRNGKRIKTFPANQFFLPEPLLMEFSYAFLKCDYESVIIDVLSATGQLIPVQLTRHYSWLAAVPMEAMVRELSK